MHEQVGAGKWVSEGVVISSLVFIFPSLIEMGALQLSQAMFTGCYISLY